MKPIDMSVRIHIILLLCLLTILSLFAQEEAPDRTFLLIPSEGAARADLSASGNIGNLVFPIQFEIPSSRGETVPTIALVYNSGNQAHGSWVGNGWSLDLGYIERSRKDGVPSFNNNDEFIIKLGNASGELVLFNTSAGKVLMLSYAFYRYINIEQEIVAG